jgi:hypothetical protein
VLPQESKSSEIVLKDDDPDALLEVLRVANLDDFETVQNRHPTRVELFESSKRLSWINTLVVAEKYCFSTDMYRHLMGNDIESPAFAKLCGKVGEQHAEFAQECS